MLNDIIPQPNLDIQRMLQTRQRDMAMQQRAEKTAEDFEVSFVSQMLKPMFEGLSTEAPFGGGNAEATWRSFMVDAMARKVVSAGGLGVTDLVMAEMLRMQEVEP